MRPGFARALWLAGIAHYQRNDYEQAGRYWQQLLPQIPAGSESASTVQEALDDLADRGVSLDQQENGPGDP
jgi:cytochrome c-type biogenesis protein CcmH/NrfG